MVDVSQRLHGTSGLGDFGSWENDVCMCLCGWVCGCHWSGRLSLSKVLQWPSVWDDKTRVLISLSHCVCVHMWVICDSWCQVLVTYAQQGTIICRRRRKMEIWELCEREKNSLKNEQQQKHPKQPPQKKKWAFMRVGSVCWLTCWSLARRHSGSAARLPDAALAIMALSWKLH